MIHHHHQQLHVYYLFQSWLWLTFAGFPTTISATTSAISKPGCAAKCGNLTIPYPFGISRECSLSYWHTINCNTSFNPPKPFIGGDFREIISISETQLRVKNLVTRLCYPEKVSISTLEYTDLRSSPYVFSVKANKFIGIGCADVAMLTGTIGNNVINIGCIAMCSKLQNVVNGSCSGFGCCQIPIPKGLDSIETKLVKVPENDETREMLLFNLCGYAFLGEQDKFTFNVGDLSDPEFSNRVRDNVPIVLDWVVGVGETCQQAKQKQSSYACYENTICHDSDSTSGGYRCSCLPGYQGNPYLSGGCTDIDECKGPTNPCSHICSNTLGNYTCTCPKGHTGDGLKTGNGCSSNHKEFVRNISLGLSLGFFFLVMLTSWVTFIIRKRKVMKLREKYFENNGGLLLNQQLSPNGGNMESSKIFSADELSVATNNYSEDRILGKGGFGTVYKGILKNGCEVAIKKSKLVDQNESQIQQFINEVVILTQINHRNVVKLLGCCLETEVPLLVYEFISNGTLFEHIHKKGGTTWLTWSNCIRVATEVANALAYLHSAASIPILHRDVKSANILLDDNYTAKIADFGASRLTPTDQTQASTLIQGTLGYLDPESLHTSQLTEKSDVYSFGVVLAELMTKEKVVSGERDIEEVHLAMHFVMSIKRNRVLEILDPGLVREASEEQLLTMAMLIKKCLNVKGSDRPTMKEVALELEGLKKQINHPWAEQTYEETISLVDQQDLYPVPSNF